MPLSSTRDAGAGGGGGQGRGVGGRAINQARLSASGGRQGGGWDAAGRGRFVYVGLAGFVGAVPKVGDDRRWEGAAGGGVRGEKQPC